MPRFTTYLTYRAWCPIKYSYICEICSAKSGVINSELEQFEQHVNKTSAKHSVSPEVGINTEEKIESKLFRRINVIKKHISTVYANPKRVMDVHDMPFISKAYNQIFEQGCVCWYCKKRQSWYPSFSRPVGYTPQVEWGENSFELIGAEDSRKETSLRQVQLKTETWIFDAYKDLDALKLIETLAGNSHLNIICIRGFDESTAQVQNPSIRTFDVLIEEFNGVGFDVYTRREIKEDIYQDLIMQLIDALEFLHGLSPPIVFNGLTSDNILVGDQNHLVLKNFEYARFDPSPQKDIQMLGELMKNANSKRRRKYEKIIRKCGGAYKSVSELRKDFNNATSQQNEKVLITVAVLLTLCFVALLVVLFAN